MSAEFYVRFSDASWYLSNRLRIAEQISLLRTFTRRVGTSSGSAQSSYRKQSCWAPNMMSGCGFKSTTCSWSSMPTPGA